MDIPSNIIEAVRETKAEIAQPTTAKPRKPYMKESSKCILHAVGNGLRTSASIANALKEPKNKIQSRLWHLKDQGLLIGEKKQGSLEFKYYLNTEQPKLGQVDLTPKKRKYTKRVAKVANVAKVEKVVEKVEQPMLGKYARELEVEVSRLTQRVSALELSLIEKDKELWTVESELFDKKAIITYLEGKLATKGVGL